MEWCGLFGQAAFKGLVSGWVVSGHMMAHVVFGRLHASCTSVMLHVLLAFCGCVMEAIDLVHG